MTLRPIRAVDGEADLPDEHGRQNYNLMVAGGKVLRPSLFSDYLHSVEIFEFLLSLPNDYLVGYYIGFDVTHWLRHVPAEKIERIFLEDKQIFGNYTWYKQYGIQYIPGQFFRVCRIEPNTFPPKALKDSARTVNETAGFFRGPFLDALATMQIGTAGEMAEIRAGKEARGKTELAADQVERYCKLECRLLAKAIGKLINQFEDCGYPLRDYRGAGAAATAMLNANPQIPQRPKQPTRPARIDCSHEEHRYPDDTRWRQAVMTAMAGGRIENRGYGAIDGELFANDINSAYPAALLTTPCPKHTNWIKFKGKPKGWRWYLAKGSWQTSDKIAWGPLPARTKEQSIIYPMSVSGWWWSPELENLEGFQFEGGWGADQECDCEPFDFINDIYADRLELGPVRGLPLKIGLAAITGKFAQRKHASAARWRDLVVAGITYSQTRRWVRDLLTDDALSVATDAIFSRKPLPIVQSKFLGEWQVTRLPDGIFTVQPGIFWTPDLTTIRARGFSKNCMMSHAKALEELWARWNPLSPPPSYTMPVDLFIGHKAAKILHQPQLVGSWKRMEIPLSFDWMPRRHHDAEMITEGNRCHVVTFAPERHQKSVIYDPSAISEMEKMDVLLREQPDG